MDILMQRLLFLWQRSIFSQRWLAALLLVNMVLLALLAYSWFGQQRLQQALQSLPRHVAATRTLKQVQVSEQMKAPAASTILQTWPTEDQADQISADILAQADALGMLFERAEFQALPLEHAALQVQRIKLPLKGEYLPLRQFLQQVLQAYPSLALSQFKLQRTDVMQPGIEAYIEFNLYTRKRGAV